MSLSLSSLHSHKHWSTFSSSFSFLQSNSSLCFCLVSFSDSPSSSLSLSTPLLWLYTHPALQLEQSSQPDSYFLYFCLARPNTNSQYEQAELWRRASLAPCITVCRILIHCLNVNAMNECCIYLMLQCMWTPASLSHPALSTPWYGVLLRWRVFCCALCQIVLRSSLFHYCYQSIYLYPTLLFCTLLF